MILHSAVHPNTQHRVECLIKLSGQGGECNVPRILMISDTTFISTSESSINGIVNCPAKRTEATINFGIIFKLNLNCSFSSASHRIPTYNNTLEPDVTIWMENDLKPDEDDIDLDLQNNIDLDAYSFKGVSKLHQLDFEPHSKLDLMDLKDKIKYKHDTHWLFYLILAVASTALISSSSVAAFLVRALCSGKFLPGKNPATNIGLVSNQTVQNNESDSSGTTVP